MILIKTVEEFQTAFKSTINKTPTLLTIEEGLLRYKLMEEENKEFLESIQNEDLVGVLDSLGDQLYVLLGTIIACGMQDVIEKAIREIHISNMSKLGDDGEPILNTPDNPHYDHRKALGKILKNPKTYLEPNLKQFL